MNDSPKSPTDLPSVAVIGGGVIGGTFITAFRLAGWPPARITVVEKDGIRANALHEAHGIAAGPKVKEAVTDADVVVIAVKPQDTALIVKDVAKSLKSGALVVTVAAGLPIAFYEAALPPGTPVIRTMPNTPAIVGHGATAISPGTHATQQHIAITSAMLRTTGLLVQVREEDLDAVTAVSGCGPAYFYAMVEALTEAGVAQGLDRIIATQLAAQTFVGAGRLLLESGDTPQNLRKRVASPGGTTMAALEAMGNAGLQDAVSAGTRAAIARAKEMAEELGGA